MHVFLAQGSYAEYCNRECCSICSIEEMCCDDTVKFIAELPSSRTCNFTFDQVFSFMDTMCGDNNNNYYYCNDCSFVFYCKLDNCHDCDSNSNFNEGNYKYSGTINLSSICPVNNCNTNIYVPILAELYATQTSLSYACNSMSTSQNSSFEQYLSSTQQLISASVTNTNLSDDSSTVAIAAVVSVLLLVLIVTVLTIIIVFILYMKRNKYTHGDVHLHEQQG